MRQTRRRVRETFGWAALCAVIGAGCEPVDMAPAALEEEGAAEEILPAALTSPANGVRVDIGPATQELQDRYVRWDGGESRTFTELGGFTAALKRADGSSGVSFRDRGDVAMGELGNLVEDGVAYGSGLRLTFTGLRAGTYQMKTYHHDATTPRGTVDVLVSDADGSNRQVANEVPVTTGTGVRVFGSAVFTFRANGSSTVTVTFKNGAVGGEVWLNGFGLTRSAFLPPARADFGASGQQTQSKHVGWTATESKSWKDLDGFSATIKRADGTGGLTWFDRGDVSGTNGNLVEDGVMSSAGLRLSLTGLKAGQYQLKTYHHDATVTQGTIDISVDDADRTGALVADEVKVSKGTSSPTIKTATIVFRASGAGDVRVYFRKGAVAGTPLVNGFELGRLYRDLDVTHIERTPRYYRYDLDYGPNNTPNAAATPVVCANNAGQKRWPDPGEAVTYTAHVKNLGTSSTPAGASYEWRAAGAVVATGTLPALGAGAETTVALVRPFPATPEALQLRTDTTGLVVETDEVNNDLTIGSHDLTLSIWVEQGLYDAFKAMPSATGAPSSFEEWIERHFAQMNARFAESTYAPFAPAGIVDRVRIDKLVVTTDVESLGFAWWACATDAADPDKTLIDGRWTFADGDSSNAVGRSWSWQWYVDYVDGFADRIDWGLIHELAHQLGLIDLYRMNLTNNTSDNNGFHVRDFGGVEIKARDLPTYAWEQILFKYPGVMVGGDTQPHTEPNFFESHSVGGMNAHAYKRRGYFGEYLYDTPAEATLKVRDPNGVPLANVTVELFQKVGDLFDDTPEVTGTTDGQGRLLLPNRSVPSFTTETGHTLRDNPFGRIHHEGWNGIMFVRATNGGAPLYGWLFVLDLNLAYWAGLEGAVECVLDLQPPRPTTDSSWPPARPPMVCGPRI